MQTLHFDNLILDQFTYSYCMAETVMARCDISVEYMPPNGAVQVEILRNLVSTTCETIAHVWGRNSITFVLNFVLILFLIHSYVHVTR